MDDRGTVVRFPIGTSEFCLLYALFWVIPRRLEFICRRFGTPCLFHLRRQVDVNFVFSKVPSIAIGPIQTYIEGKSTLPTSFYGGKNGRCLQLTTRFHQLPKLI